MFIGNPRLGRKNTINLPDSVSVAPTITSSTMPDPAYGVAYSHSCTATGSTPITWTIATGALPTGLSINAGTGAITGTPTASGAFTGTIRATNAAGYAEQAFSVVVSYLSKVQSIAGANLVALYSLIGSSNPANDLSGNGYHGTINGATPAGGAVVPFPEGGNAMLFDAVNDYVNLAALLGHVNTTTGTALAWIRRDTWTGSTSKNIINFSASSGIQGAIGAYIPDSAPTKIRADFYGSGTGGSIDSAAQSSTGWLCVMVTWRESNKARLWIGGVSAGLTNNAAGAFGMPAVSSISTSTSPFGGDICMVMWADADLSASAVALATP